MATETISPGDIRLDVAAALYRLAEVVLLHQDALDALCGAGVPGAADDAAIDALTNKQSKAERKLADELTLLGYRDEGILPPMRGSDGKRLLIEHWSYGEGRVWATAKWLADHDIDLQIACQVQAVQRTARAQEATV